MKRLFLLLALTSTYSFAETRPIKVAVFGDSVTAAVFANETIGYPSRNFYRDMKKVVDTFFFSTIFGHTVDPRNKSTLEEFNAVAGRFKRTHYSFALGRAKYSLRAKVRRKLGVDLDIVDVSLLATGYQFSDIALKNLAANVRRTKIAPDVILVNYTAIDFLRNKSVEQFRAYTNKFYEELVEKYPDSNIVMGQLLNPIPNLIRPDRIAAPISPLFLIPGIPFTCKKSFELMKFGKEMKMGPGYRGPRIAAHEKRLEKFRQTLENLAQKIANKEGVFEKFRGEFTYAEDRAVEETLKHDVAADCIHPTVKGHKAIAEVFWNHAEHLFSDDMLPNYDFSSLPPKCDNERGYGRKFWCGFGFCAKKSEDLVTSDDESSFCRVTKY